MSYSITTSKITIIIIMIITYDKNKNDFEKIARENLEWLQNKHEYTDAGSVQVFQIHNCISVYIYKL